MKVVADLPTKNKRQTLHSHQFFEPLWVFQMRLFQAKTALFDTLKKGFNTPAIAVMSKEFFDWQGSAYQQPVAIKLSQGHIEPNTINDHSLEIAFLMLSQQRIRSPDLSVAQGQ